MIDTNRDIIKQVKSRLLPLPPWEAVLEWLIERLPRKFLTLQLIAQHNIVEIDVAQGEFRSTGPSPRFALHSTSALIQRGGWFYLEASLVRNTGNREAFLIAAEADGNVITIPIPTNLRGTVREVFYLPSNIQTLHWSPTADAGFFSQSPLLLHRISWLESILRRQYRVIPDLWCMGQASTPQEILTGLWKAFIHPHTSYLENAQFRSNRLVGNNYATFLRLHKRRQKRDLVLLRRQIPTWIAPPKISLIVVLQSPTLPMLQETIASVTNQIYPHWELVIIGEANDEIAQSLQAGYKNHPKIHIIIQSENRERATLFNTALMTCQGHLVGQVGQHDLLPHDSLARIAQHWQHHPECDLIYTDEDTLDGEGNRCQPVFKPDWNPALFYSYFYLGHLCLYRREKVKKIGGYRTGLSKNEEYDLCLRLIRNFPNLRIDHVTSIGYHHRQLKNTPTTKYQSGQMHQAGKRALEDHFKESGSVITDGPQAGLYRLIHPLPKPEPLVSIIIPTKNRANILIPCIESILKKTSYPSWELLIVDNQSSEQTALQYLNTVQMDPRVKVLRYDHPFNFSAINNYAVQQSTGQIIALVNNDVEILTSDWLEEMVSYALQPAIGAVGAKLLYGNNTIQHAGVILGIGGVAGHAHKYLPHDAPGYCHRAIVTQNVSAVTAACLIVRKELYLEVDGLNAKDFVVAFNDIDFCLKLVSHGYQNIFTPFAQLHHHESISRGHDDTPEKQAIFSREFQSMKRLWGERLTNDPAYNPNLSLEFEGFSLKMRI